MSGFETDKSENVKANRALRDLAARAAVQAGKKAILKLLKHFVIWFIGLVGPQLLLLLLIFAVIFAPVAGLLSEYNYTSAPKGNRTLDARLTVLYNSVAGKTVSQGILAIDPGAVIYRIPFGMFAAVDKILNNNENPKPEDYIEGLKPVFHLRDSEIKYIHTTTCSDGSVSESVEVKPIKLIDTVETYEGVYRHHYTWADFPEGSEPALVQEPLPKSYLPTKPVISRSLGSLLVPEKPSNSSSLLDEDNGAFETVTCSTSTTVRMEILSGIEQPHPKDYTKLAAALKPLGITNQLDQETVYQLSLRYAEQEVDTTDSLNLLGIGGGGGGFTLAGEAPPADWIPYFRRAAERFHGSTDAGEFMALLLAVGYTESGFRNSGDVVSSAGALGPMQFMPETWESYGVKQLGYTEDDIWDPEKAVMAAALMLSRNGAGKGTVDGIRDALYVYNHSTEYGNIVIGRMYYFAQYTGWVPPDDFLIPAEASRKGFYWPVPGYRTISSPYGIRLHPIYNTYRLHDGIDIPAPAETPIIAAKDGVVEEVSFSKPAYGYYIRIRHEGGIETFYGHMNSIRPQIVKDAQVKAGQIIAGVGTRGDSTGFHLHFGVLYNGDSYNPLQFVNQP